jgi:hypothetical protein
MGRLGSNIARRWLDSDRAAALRAEDTRCAAPCATGCLHQASAGAKCKRRSEMVGGPAPARPGEPAPAPPRGPRAAVRHAARARARARARAWCGGAVHDDTGGLSGAAPRPRPWRGRDRQSRRGWQSDDTCCGGNRGGSGSSGSGSYARPAVLARLPAAPRWPPPRRQAALAGGPIGRRGGGGPAARSRRPLLHQPVGGEWRAGGLAGWGAGGQGWRCTRPHPAPPYPRRTRWRGALCGCGDSVGGGRGGVSLLSDAAAVCQVPESTLSSCARLVSPKRLLDMSRRGCISPANASGSAPHRASISSCLGQEAAGRFAAADAAWQRSWREGAGELGRMGAADVTALCY